MHEPENLASLCRCRVAELSQREGWGLTGRQIDEYVEQIMRQVPERALVPQLDQVVRYYHGDHRLFAALRDEQHAEHAEAWAWAMREIGQAARHKGLEWSKDRAVEIDDLVQTVQAELFRAIGGYRFESSLRTWLHSVTVQRLRRFHRDSSAAKRTAYLEPIEEADTQAVEWSRFEQEILASVLVAHIRQVLEAAGDERYARIFLMRVVEGRSAEEIGVHVRLHASRVRGLLQIVRELLQHDATLRDWQQNNPDLAQEATALEIGVTTTPAEDQ